MVGSHGLENMWLDEFILHITSVRCSFHHYLCEAKTTKTTFYSCNPFISLLRNKITDLNQPLQISITFPIGNTLLCFYKYHRVQWKVVSTDWCVSKIVFLYVAVICYQLPVQVLTGHFLMRQLLLDLGNGFTRVQVFGADLGTVHDRMASIKLECIVQFRQSLLGRAIPRVFDPTVCLHQNRRSQVLVGIPPITWTRRRAASTQNAFVHTIQLGTILFGLQKLGLAWFLVFRRLQPRFDATVLLVEVAHIRN